MLVNSLSRDQLIAIRDRTTTTIPRYIRKTLIKNNIWCPISQRRVPVKPKCAPFKTFIGTKCGLLNPRSINDKETYISELITDNDIDILAITETWCSEKSDVSLGLITPPGYSILHTPRPSRGGGVGLIYRNSYDAKLVKIGNYPSLEYQTTVLKFGTDSLNVTCIYLPKGYNGSISSELNDLFSQLQLLSGRNLILGDFNVHVNNITEPDTIKLNELICQYNLSQHVSIPTHRDGNTLDIILTREDISVSDISSDQSICSDHYAVLFKISSISPGLPKRTVHYRRH
jgi:hypothetical protein